MLCSCDRPLFSRASCPTWRGSRACRLVHARLGPLTAVLLSPYVRARPRLSLTQRACSRIRAARDFSKAPHARESSSRSSWRLPDLPHACALGPPATRPLLLSPLPLPSPRILQLACPRGPADPADSFGHRLPPPMPEPGPRAWDSDASSPRQRRVHGAQGRHWQGMRRDQACAKGDKTGDQSKQLHAALPSDAISCRPDASARSMRIGGGRSDRKIRSSARRTPVGQTT